MMPITALNEKRKTVALEETKSSIECQESIVESEYIRAITLKSVGKSELSLHLLNELLETEVLSEIFTDDKSKKLKTIRYNCYKNIAFIHEEKCENELALQNYIWAIELDDTDVYTLNRFGQLALNSNALEIAQFAFELCLKQNPDHWKAGCGILQTLCQSHNVLEACNWAVKLLKNKHCSNMAAATLKEIATKFPTLVPFYEKICDYAFASFIDTLALENKEDHNMFPLQDNNYKETITTVATPDLSDYCSSQADWYTMGKLLIAIYKVLNGTQCLFATLEVQNLFVSNKTDELDENIASNINSPTDVCNDNTNSSKNVKEMEVDDSAEDNAAAIEINENTNRKLSPDDIRMDFDRNKKGDFVETNEINKPKLKRRCSDLSSLEQWGWHKTRRYARKRSQQDRNEVETSLSTTVWKFFKTYKIPSDDSSWPFNDSSTAADCNNGSKVCGKCKQLLTKEEFLSQTKIEFDLLMEKLEKEPFDVILLTYKWLKQVAMFWHESLPIDLASIYLNVFKIYMENFDLSNWDQLDARNFGASYRICLLYLELSTNKQLNDTEAYTSEWFMVFDHLMFSYGKAYITFGNKFDEYELRLLALKSMRCFNQNQMKETINSLKMILNLLEKQNVDYVFHIPNSASECLTKNSVEQQISNMRREISLCNVPRLYDEENWTELIVVLSENILNSIDNNCCNNWSKDFKIQSELLLQSLWNTNAFEVCLSWSEKFFHYFVCLHLSDIGNSLRQNQCIDSINYVLSYIKGIIDSKGNQIVSSLASNLDRLIHNIIRILAYVLDAPYAKNAAFSCNIDLNKMWMILHQIVQRDENESPIEIPSNDDCLDEESLIPASFLILFTAHDFLGKRQLCTKDKGGMLFYILDVITPIIKAPLYDHCRDMVNEYLEQVTHCLFGFPAKKARSRHLEDHEANQAELTWPKAIQIYDLYRPICLPELNSYKLESITADMEQFFLRILNLMPKEDDPNSETQAISNYIAGDSDTLPNTEHDRLPSKIRTIFYVLGDFYFKNRDFSKAIKYYIPDISINLERYDSWAGLALSKASQIETKINGFTNLSLSNLITDSNAAIRCFDRCTTLNKRLTLLWIEYGSFTYMLHSYFSRFLKQKLHKQTAEDISMAKEYKAKMLQISLDCFQYVSNLQSKCAHNQEDSDDMHEEKWLCQFMLGKIAEKKKSSPSVYLNYYLTAANYLYESKATYPIKINHSNPTTLSVEALEVFYRINASMVKYLEQQENLTRENGVLFKNVLKSLSTSPFAFNKAKVDGSCITIGKRKLELANDERTNSKRICAPKETSCSKTSDDKNANDKQKFVTKNTSRRESQESSINGTTFIASSSTSTANSDSSLDTETDSNASKENEMKTHQDSLFFTSSELKNIFKALICNLEECATRFPEHYKSIYRLVHLYMTDIEYVSDLDRSLQLVIGYYKTGLGNQINGLFFERKNNNLFNGIWRIPSSEVDRPGSFSAHLVKCVHLLLKVLLKSENYKLLIEISLNLFKTPENDKRYIVEEERIELNQLAIKFCVEAIENKLKQFVDKKDHDAILELLLDIYKTYKKYLKHYNKKQSVFSSLLAKVYKHYIESKTEVLSDNHIFTCDQAIKHCLHVINFRKYCEKMQKAKNDESSAQLLSASMPANTSTMSNTSLTQPTISAPSRPVSNADISNDNLLSSIFDQNVNVNFENLFKDLPNEMLQTQTKFSTDFHNMPETFPLACFTPPNALNQDTKNENFGFASNANNPYFPLKNLLPTMANNELTITPSATTTLASTSQNFSSDLSNLYDAPTTQHTTTQPTTGQINTPTMFSGHPLPINLNAFPTTRASLPAMTSHFTDTNDISFRPSPNISLHTEIPLNAHSGILSPQSSSVKTLQQKLVERQKVGKQNSKVDVIILD